MRRDRLAVAAAAAAVVLGVALVTAGARYSLAGSPSAEAWFWAGMVAIFAPAAIVVLTRDLSRGQGLTLVLVVAAGLYAVKVLHSPVVFSGYDELLHYRTLDDLVRTGALFHENPLLPISPFYPGLEVVTSAIMAVTGLDPVAAGLLLVGAARMLMCAAFYVLLERTLVPQRLAALGALMYTAAPTFLFFDSQFGYESLALPFAVFCLLLLRMAQREDGYRRTALNVLGFLAALGVIATHHVTSLILIVALLAWTLTALVVRKREPKPLPGGGWVAIAAAAAGVAWLVLVASATVGYILPHIVSGFDEVLRIIAREESGRKLFQSSSGHSAPMLERLTGLAAAGLIVLCIPLAVLHVRDRQRRDPLAILLVTATFAYPATLLLRFTKSGWEVASRATAFLFIPLAFMLASAVEQTGALTLERLDPRLRNAAVAAVLVVIFTGGVVAGSSSLSRLPKPYAPGGGEVSVEGEGVAAARWASADLGPGHRLVADSVNASLLGSYGRQRIVTSADDVSVSELFLPPDFGTHAREEIGRAKIQYFVIDRRIAGVQPLGGFFYEKWERGVVDTGSTVSTETLSRFDGMPEVSRVFDSGDIQLYDVTRIAR